MIRKVLTLMMMTIADSPCAFSFSYQGLSLQRICNSIPFTANASVSSKNTRRSQWRRHVILLRRLHRGLQSSNLLEFSSNEKIFYRIFPVICWFASSKQIDGTSDKNSYWNFNANLWFNRHLALPLQNLTHFSYWSNRLLGICRNENKRSLTNVQFVTVPTCGRLDK